MSAVIDCSRISDKQIRFMRASTKHVGYGGARGGGKSWAVRTKAVILACTYPGIRILIVRKTYSELYLNHIETLRASTKDIARYIDQKKELRFNNNSAIFFRYCANDGDLLQYQGAEFDVIFFDEATQLTENQMRTIGVCVRGVNGFPKRIYYTCNPGGAGHHYIKRLFIDRNYTAGENPADYSFIQALPQDNIALMESQPDYIETLKALPPKQRAAWLEGRWDVFEGQFFEEFTDDPEHYEDRRWTHVIEPFAIPYGWQIYRSFDFGYAKPFSAAWWAIDYDGVLYRIKELYGYTGTPNEGVKWIPDDIFGKMAEIEQTHPDLRGRNIIGVADPSIWDASRGEMVVEAAERHGVYFSPGDNKRIPGWMQCHYRLSFSEHGYPMMYVFKNCKEFIRTIPLLEYSATQLEDLNTDLEDHIADEWRYMCMSRPLTPPRPAEPPKRRAPIFEALDIDPSTL